MACHGSPQDLFASEDSDSDATVDLSVSSSTEACQRDSEEGMLSCAKQNEKQRILQRPSQHAVSSSDSEDDNARSSSSVNAVHANSDAGACSTENGAVADADKRVVCSHRPVTDLLSDRLLCKYGEKCYRRNPSHFQEFRHPGDEHVKVTDSDGSSCSPSKRRRTETTSSSSLNSSSESSADEHCSLFASSNASSLTSAAVIDHCQPVSFFLTKVEGIQSKFNQSRALGIKDLLSLGNLVQSAQFNYCIDIKWLLLQYPAEFRSLPLLIVHGDKNEDWTELELEAMRYPNISLCQARLDLPYGTHHTKMMLLLYDDGLRVVIHTANLVDGDWAQKTQGIWVSPLFPPLPDPGGDSIGDSVTHFKRDLLEYLSAYRHQRLTAWIEIAKRHDFSAAKVYLIASVPGRHVGNRRNCFGHMKLRHVLSHCGPELAAVVGWPVIGQFSSIGSLGASADMWLRGEWLESTSAVRSGRELLNASAKPQLKLVFPSVDNVRTSLEGYIAGGSLPYSINTARRQPWLNTFLHQWKSDGCGRSWASPHIKSYTRVSPDASRLAWFLVTSANLSKAAWGSLEKNASQLMIRSYELGVLFLPQHFGACDGSFVTNPQHSTEQSIIFTPPFDLPLTPYTAKDRPWIVDLAYSEVDSHGCQWSPS